MLAKLLNSLNTWEAELAASACLGGVGLWLAARVDTWGSSTWLVFLGVVGVFVWVSGVRLGRRLFPEDMNRAGKSKTQKTVEREHRRP